MDPGVGLLLVTALVLVAFLRKGTRALQSHRQYLAVDEPIVVKGLCPEISFVHERLLNREGDEGIPTGDFEFDRQFHLDGPEAVVRALFDVRARAQTLELLTGESPLKDLVLRDGELSMDPRGWIPRERALIAERVQALGRCFEPPADVAQRLAETLRNEVEPAARRLQLASLAREFPGHAATLRALRRWTADDDPELRLIAAIALGGDGRLALKALARDEDIDDSISARAIEALGAQLGVDDAAPILAAALESARRHSVLQDFKRRDTARACVAALAQSGEPAAEDALVGALACDDNDVRVAAAAALGRMGSVAVVEALQAAAVRHGGGLRRAVQDAVDQIQSRVAATGGEVALSASDAGQVSMADGAEGAVSLPAREKPAAD